MKIAYLRNIFLSTLVLSIVLLTAACKKTASTGDVVNAPTVATNNVIINLTATSAQSGGVILSAGGGTITGNGVVYSSTNKTPTTADSKTTDPVSTEGTALKTITSNLANLTPNTTYYLRAYAINSGGVGYGGVSKFTTSATLGSVVGTVTTFAGSGVQGSADGSGISAQFNNPQGISVDSKGNLYISDTYNDLIREIAPDGTVTTIAGSQTIGYVDGPVASAQFYAPKGSAFDSQGNLYIADFGNNVIRKISAGVVTTYAGTGKAGYKNGEATPSALKSTSDSLCEFNNPQAVAVDAAGNVYVADRGNNVIRKISPAGRVITIAGTRHAGFLDGTDESASFNTPSGVAVDAAGNVYVTDQGNSALRKISPAGVVTTLAGNPSQSTLLNFPAALAIDSQGNLFIVDEGGRVLEYSTTTTALYDLAGGLNVAGYADGSGPLAQFNSPQSIAVDANNNIYVVDQNNNRIRKLVVTTIAN